MADQQQLELLKRIISEQQEREQQAADVSLDLKDLENKMRDQAQELIEPLARRVMDARQD